MLAPPLVCAPSDCRKANRADKRRTVPDDWPVSGDRVVHPNSYSILLRFFETVRPQRTTRVQGGRVQQTRRVPLVPLTPNSFRDVSGRDGAAIWRVAWVTTSCRVNRIRGLRTTKWLRICAMDDHLSLPLRCFFAPCPGGGRKATLGLGFELT